MKAYVLRLDLHIFVKNKEGMPMGFIMPRLYEVMVIFYATSTVLYFIDFFYKKVKIRRIAFWFISYVWILQTAFLILHVIDTKRFPILSLTDGIYFYAWLLVSLSIVLHCIARVDLPVFFMNLLGFIFVTIHLFVPERIQNPLIESLESEMLFIHIFFAMISYAAFTLSFVFSIVYLILYRSLKEKKINNLWSRLPSLTQMSSWMRSSILVGVPILLISLLLGLERGYLTLDNFTLLDFKIIGSFVITCLYFVIFILFQKGKITPVNFAWTQIYSYLIIVLNFFVGSKLSSFHIWY